MVGVADAVKRLLGESMKTWRTNLTANNDSLGKVCIRRGIFQGDSLSPLLFVLALRARIWGKYPQDCRACSSKFLLDQNIYFTRPESK